MPYLSFYIGTPDDLFKDPSTETTYNLHSVRILESSSLNTDFTVIDTVKLQHGENYVSTHNGSTDYIHKFYRLEFISDPAVTPVSVYFRTDAVLPEVIAEIVDDIREWLHDTNLDDPAFKEHEYLQMIRFALRQMKGEKNLQTINEDDKYLLQFLVRESTANILAHDYAKYMKLEHPTHPLDQWQIGAHYLEVARAYREQYSSYEKRLNMQDGGYNDSNIITQMPGVKQVTAHRYIRSKGIRTSGRNIVPRRTSFVDPNG